MNYRPHHTAISVRDLDKSVDFYKSLGYGQVHSYDEEDDSMSIVHLKLNLRVRPLIPRQLEKEVPELSIVGRFPGCFQLKYLFCLCFL